MKKQQFNYEDIINFNAPNNPTMESSLLSGVINRPDAIKELESFISHDCFFDPINRDVWKSIMALYSSGKHIDMITVASEASKLNPAITPYQVLKIANSATFFQKEIIEFAMMIKELEMKRKLQINAVSTIMGIMNNDDVADIIADSEKKINEINNSTVLTSTTKEIKDVLIDCEVELQKRIENKGAIGVKSGIKSLDQMIGGFKGSELIVIGARPAMGKTATLLKIIGNASLDGFQTAIFSLEMSSVRLVDRLIIAKSGVDAYKYRNGFLDKSEVNQVFSANNDLSRLKMTIDDKANQSVNYIRAVSRKLKKSKGLDIIAVDYLQLVENGESRSGNREQEVSVISRSLKLLAKELDIPVILLCQLNRSVEQRADKMPMLSDLRESGAIEQDADVVLFLRRMYTYSQNEAERNEMDIMIAKQREGATGPVKCWVNDSMTDIRDFNEMQTPF